VKDRKIGVVFGGPSSESAISKRSADNVFAALKRKSYDVSMVELDRNIVENIKLKKIEVAYLITHGNPGEDGSVQGLFELLGIPYTYSGVLASALALDKHLAKVMMKRDAVPVLEDRMIDKGSLAVMMKKTIEELAFPIIMKPNKEGSSVGISVIRNKSEWEDKLPKAVNQYGPMIVEPFIEGREITVGVFQETGDKLTALPIIELKPKNAFYDFEAKYTKGMTEFICPAKFEPLLTEQIAKASLSAFKALGCSGAVRVDFMVDGQNFWALEVNTIPGMTETSDLPMAAAATGISFDDLVEKILLTAALKK